MTESSRAVFLSYASQDVDAARRICEALRAAGIEVWFDQSALRGGDAWDASIRKQIKACALFVPVISRNTHTRDEGYFRLEWKLAVDRSHLMAVDRTFLLPVVVDDTPDNDERVPDKFRDVQWTRLPGGAVSNAFIERVARLLLPDASPADTRATETGLDGIGVQGRPGARRASAPAAARPKVSRSNWSLLLVALLALAAGYLAFSRFVPSRRAVPEAVTVANPPAASASGAVADRSIAVLPFADMSEKKDQEYFSDGLAEELLDLLAKTPGLRVTARTSSFYFKGKQATVGEIAKTLGVAHLLEGSVRKAGNRLRVTTQLIRTDTGEHVWSETYDRELKDVFAVQDEIAAAVVTALKLRLSAAAAPMHAPKAVVPEAYDRFLLARQLISRGSRESGERLRASLEEAIRLDPGFAPAYALLGNSQILEAAATDDAAGYARARATIDKALALDPELADAFVARSRLRLYRLDFAGAQADAELALRLAPGDTRALAVHADVLQTYGRLSDAIATLQRAAALDPLDRVAWSHMGNVLLGTADRVAARRALERALDISPESENALDGLWTLDLLEGHPDRTLAAARAHVGDRPIDAYFFVSMAEHALGHPEASDQALRALVGCCANYGAYQVAVAYAWRGEKDPALTWLERAYRQTDSALPGVLSDPLLNSVRNEPRFRALLRKLNLPD